MAIKPQFSTKRALITKANSTMVIVVAAASFITVFSLIASKALLSQHAYQARVTTEKEKAVKQLKANISAVQNLQNSYQALVSTSENVLGGNPKGQGDRDGDNAKIILDALPSKYDFPALATSLEKLLNSPNYKIDSITGIDDEVNQQANDKGSASPSPVDIPFQVSVTGSYGSMKTLIQTLEASIRPIQVQALDFTGTDSTMHVSITAKTFYQPEKNLTIDTKVVK